MAVLLLVAVLCVYSDNLAAFISQLIVSWFYSESNHDSSLRSILVDIKKEMNSISMADEFARYAKLQRKYNKLEAELKERRGDRLSKRVKLRLSFTYGSKFISGIITSILLFKYRGEPVIHYPWHLFWPLEGILSWPCEENQCISLCMCIIILRLLTYCYKKYFGKTSSLEKNPQELLVNQS